MDSTDSAGEWAETRNHAVRLHHQIDQAFLIYLTDVKKKHWKAWVQGYFSIPPIYMQKYNITITLGKRKQSMHTFHGIIVLFFFLLGSPC